jgi:hypothetical protein
MQKEKTKLNITFHNPNTPEMTEKFLCKIIAQNLVERVIKQQSEVAKQAELATYHELTTAQ